MNIGTAVKHSYTLDESEMEISCSGLYIGNGFILTHSILLDDIIFNKAASPIRDALLNHNSFFDTGNEITNILKPFDSVFTVHLHRDLEKQLLKGLSRPTLTQNKYVITSNNCSSNVISYQARLCLLVMEHNFRAELNKILPEQDGWNLSGDVKNQSVDNNLLLSTVAILFIDYEGTVSCNFNQLKKNLQILNRLSATPSKGISVLIESTPFGTSSPEIFINSLSEGILSNTSGSNSALMITDASCIIGSEGAAAYCRQHNRLNLCGLVALTFCTKSGEWIGLSLLMSFKLVTESVIHAINEVVLNEDISPLTRFKETRLLQLQSKNNGLGKDWKMLFDNTEVQFQQDHHSENIKMTDCIDQAQKSIVRVYQNDIWGSGVIVNSSPGVILTCAHVLKGNKNQKVIVELYDGKQFDGYIAYKTEPTMKSEESKHNQFHRGMLWDIAVVSTGDLPVPALNLSNELPKLGTSVMIIGHGLFSRKRLTSPSTVTGIISKVLYLPQSSIKTLSPPKYKLTTVDTINSNIERNENKSTNVPIMLQTTCTVYSGYSGAPVLQLHEDGLTVVGIVVSTTKDKINRAAFPNVNLAIPSLQLFPAITEYIETNDSTYLQKLNILSPAAEKLWSLGKLPKHKL